MSNKKKLRLACAVLGGLMIIFYFYKTLVNAELTTYQSEKLVKIDHVFVVKEPNPKIKTNNAQSQARKVEEKHHLINAQDDDDDDDNDDNKLATLYFKQKEMLAQQKLELEKTRAQLADLEEQIRAIQANVPRKYPKVKYLNYKNRKRILITGGAGFVGSHLVDNLMIEGHEVIVVDNFFTGRKRNVEHWLGHENFELIHHDIVNPLFIEVDEIYHLASPASPPHYMYNPVKTIKTNTMGTINVLGLAKRVMAKVLIASTSEVYGDPTVHPQPETYWGHVNPIGPRACYDEGKRVSETLSYAYAKQEKVDVRVARIFNTYGPRMHMNDGRVVSNFILQALKNETITVYGNGKQTRSFQYVSDLVDGLISLMASNYTQPVNLGNPVEHTIEEFAIIIKKLVGGQSEVKQTEAVEDDPQRRKPDITRAKTYLNWEPKVPLKVGLERTIGYFRNELKRSDHFQESSNKFFDTPDLYQRSSQLRNNQMKKRHFIDIVYQNSNNNKLIDNKNPNSPQ